MSAVLGIDAAWTRTNPSGVALAADAGSGWHLVSIAASYAEFLGEPYSTDPHLAEKLLLKAKELTGQEVAIVAVDMPLSHQPIAARRASDDALSKAYEARHAGTHTASAIRPGPISAELTQGFARLGYGLMTRYSDGKLAEVYPHPALIEYMKADRRLPYKYGKIGKYWPDDTPVARIGKLRSIWQQIVTAVDTRLPGTAEALPLPPEGTKGKAMKAYEDMLDAAICACIGISVLIGDVQGFGDEVSTIWVPRR